MNPRIQQLINAGESRRVEYKTAQSDLNNDLFETICAFLNRDGGDILLGARDDGTAVGVDPNSVERMKQDFANTINNPTKINPPCYLGIEDVEYEGVTLLHVTVPPSSQVHRCRNRIFDRNEDGDFDITDNQALVAQLYIGKQSHYTENTIYPYASMADLNPDLIERARKLAVGHQPNHPWGGLDDLTLLKSAQLWQRDYLQDKSGFTLAAILLFGQDSIILSVLPHHRTDAILRRVKVDRYDDRDDIRTNLLDSRDRLLAFGEKHLDDPFHLEDDQRISLRGIILREVIGNLLIHREYTQAFPAKFVIGKDRIFTENGNRPHGHGAIDPNLFSPYPKNPAIARVFKEIGWADELGSGVRNLFHYCRAYCGHDPELVENDVFRFELPVSQASEKTSGTGSGITSEETSEKIIELIRKNGNITIPEMAEKIGVSSRAVDKQIGKLKKGGRIKREGPQTFGGKWKVIQ